MLTITVNLPRNQWYATQYCAKELTILRRNPNKDEDREVFTVALGDKMWNLSPDGTGVVIK